MGGNRKFTLQADFWAGSRSRSVAASPQMGLESGERGVSGQRRFGDSRFFLVTLFAEKEVS
jgi:hypothetical protein